MKKLMDFALPLFTIIVSCASHSSWIFPLMTQIFYGIFVNNKLHDFSVTTRFYIYARKENKNLLTTQVYARQIVSRRDTRNFTQGAHHCIQLNKYILTAHPDKLCQIAPSSIFLAKLITNGDFKHLGNTNNLAFFLNIVDYPQNLLEFPLKIPFPKN